MKTFHYLPRGPFQTPDGYDAAPALRDALKRWEKSGSVKFIEGSGDNQIVFEFGELDEAVAAHTFLAEREGDAIRIVLNDEKNWSLTTGFWNIFTFGAENAVAVFCHEIGHAIFGAGHAPNNANSVMVQNDDTNGIYQARYPTAYDFVNLKNLS